LQQLKNISIKPRFCIKNEKEIDRMKTKEEITQQLLATLAELQSKTAKGSLEKYLRIKLEILNDILGDDAPEEFWEQIENEIYK
jgi:hypothetical protein